MKALAKVIKINISEQLEKVVEEVKAALSTSKLPNGRFTYTKDFGTVDKKATLIYSTKAWLKTKLLVDHFNSEVAWHGIAHRVEGQECTYKIEDVEVYPQEVTGATVTTDQEKYTAWLYQHDDEVFNSIRAQCHSHVNMGVTPSGTDTTLYERLLGQLGPEDFYIFTIHNKKGDMTRIIYDMKENLSFETKDVNLVVEGCEGFISEADKVVTKHTYQKGNYSYGSYDYYDGYVSGYDSGYGTSGYKGYTGQTGYQRGGAPASTGKPAPGSVTPASGGNRMGYKKN